MRRVLRALPRRHSALATKGWPQAFEAPATELPTYPWAKALRFCDSSFSVSLV